MSVFEDKQPAMRAGEKKYRAFLLRCWQVEETRPDGEDAWRFALVHFDGKQTKKGFASLEEMVAYLRDELACAGDAGERPADAKGRRHQSAPDLKETQTPGIDAAGRRHGRH